MSQSISCSIVFSANHAGLSDLRAQLIDTAGANVGSAVSTGFVVIGSAANGNYGWTGNVADDFQGFINFYSLATPTIAAMVAVNQLAIPSASDVWAYTVRTLTGVAGVLTVVSPVASSGAISIRRGDTVLIVLTGLGNISARTKLYFTVKDNLQASDAESIIQIEETAGLLVLNGASAATSSDGSIVVNDAVEGNITVTLKAALTNVLAIQSGWRYDAQIVTATSVNTLAEGTASIIADVTRMIA